MFQKDRESNTREGWRCSCDEYQHFRCHKVIHQCRIDVHRKAKAVPKEMLHWDTHRAEILRADINMSHHTVILLFCLTKTKMFEQPLLGPMRSGNHESVCVPIVHVSQDVSHKAKITNKNSCVQRYLGTFGFWGVTAILTCWNSRRATCGSGPRFLVEVGLTEPLFLHCSCVLVDLNWTLDLGPHNVGSLLSPNQSQEHSGCSDISKNS